MPVLPPKGSILGALDEEPSSVETHDAYPVRSRRGTMQRTPFDSIAGSQPEAVWPRSAGSVSVISSVTRAGMSIEIGAPSCRASVTSMFSWR